MAADDTLQTTGDPDLKEIREEFTDAADQWRDIRDAARVDLRYVTGNPWEDKARRSREQANRPILSPDETSQYVNQVVNDVRQNPRAIKVTAMSAGANEQTATARADLIRQIEYRSNAQQAYTTTFENAVQRSYGYHRIVADFTDHRSFDKELRILPCENPDMVTPDPYAVRTDGSDWKFLYFGESWRVKDFRAKWPTAKRQSFGMVEMQEAQGWVTSDTRLLIAERWQVKTKKRILLLIKAQDGQRGTAFKDELQSLPRGATVERDREVDFPYVCKQVTNGLEILETVEFKATTIPFVSCYGKIVYGDFGTGPEKRILSLIRLARDPQMLHAYIWTCIAEAIGSVPRNSWIGYEGQFLNPTDWQKANHEPVAYLEAKATIDALGGQTLLPLPQRSPWDPPIQNLLVAAEAARRSIQAAMGITPLPTEAQRRNEKSGRALQKIEDSAQRGSYHLVDHYDEGITRTGAILNDWLPHAYDAARDITVRKADDKVEQIRVNDETDDKAVDLRVGIHDVTISVGPAFSSAREAASDFVDTLLASPLMQILPPPVAAEIMALAVKLKDVGPIGDQIAETISPSKKDGQEGEPTAQQVAQMQAMIQELQQKLQAAVQEIQTDAAKQRATIEKAKIDAQASLAMAQMAEQTKIAVAKLSNLVKPDQQQAADAIEAELTRKFDLIKAEIDHAHAMELEKLKADTAALRLEGQHQQKLQQGEQSHGHRVMEGEQGHTHALAEGRQSHDQALEAGEQGIAGKLAVEESKPKPAPAGEA